VRHVDVWQDFSGLCCLGMVILLVSWDVILLVSWDGYSAGVLGWLFCWCLGMVILLVSWDGYSAGVLG